MLAVLGLGNPGRAYARSRHNVGFWCVEQVAREHHIPLGERRRHAVLGQGSIAGLPVVLAKPRTFMNRSGIAARYLAQRFALRPEQLLVVHDDMDLPLGTLRLRPRGSSAGHHGLESTMAELRTQEFLRLRIGVGRPPPGQDPVGFVLAPFAPGEGQAIRETVARAAEAVAWLAEHGLESAMNRYN
ncbi:MAG: aminoacyl-tRNA hydrolase [Chloroflexi bacterium]|nr:aminoacyl-tRNA hydrolase [Chloroflexota bacterium]